MDKLIFKVHNRSTEILALFLLFFIIIMQDFYSSKDSALQNGCRQYSNNMIQYKMDQRVMFLGCCPYTSFTDPEQALADPIFLSIRGHRYFEKVIPLMYS